MKQATFQIDEKPEEKVDEKINTEKIVKNTDITTSIASIKKPIKKVENIYYL